MYANVFAQLCVQVPFTEFQMAVLREANVAPAQLHPNSWAAMQAFLAMCLVVGVTPTIPVFFHYFEIIIDASGRREFHDVAGNPLFPFYWTREPRNIKAFPVGVLNLADLEAVRTINALSRRISARHLVECLRHEDCERKAFDLMTAPTPRQSNFMASRKGAGASSSSARTKGTPTALCPPVVRRSSSTSRMPPVTIVEPQSAPLVEATRGPVPVGRAPVVEPVPSLGAVFVDPSSQAATASAAPLVRKRKDPAGEGHKDKEASSSRSALKKTRKGKEKVPSPPLPSGIFSPAFNMSDRTKFHMSSSQRALIEPLSEVELTNAMMKMSTRAASLAWYLREFADRRGVDVVRAELLAEKKNSASLRSAMEEMISTHDDYDKKIEQLEADLEKAKKESADAIDRLTGARNDYEGLMEECSQLKAKVSRQKNSKNGLLRLNRVLTDDLARAKEKISELEAGIVFEPEEGFNKALRQASVLAGIQEPFALGFDIEKDVFDGVLVDLNTMVDGEAPEIEGPPSATVVDEAVEVEDVDDEAEDGDS
ncbi:hypothetical protein LR48_Vigan07g088700 [Vigna angularis]|uniref:Transposase (putative) gypsy type domain-containing protein n=1 Tax=Phaseolus angularis TaxID=3914 RepID=A0A0L9UWN4_PHAAN|nr:hypothetical protein LR48_Vigan07g088700 [Vigna angularis]